MDALSLVVVSGDDTTVSELSMEGPKPSDTVTAIERVFDHITHFASTTQPFSEHFSPQWSKVE